jgi:hypothetical protein
MKKTYLTVVLVLLALGVVGVGAVLAQGQNPPVNPGTGVLHAYMTQALADVLGLSVDEFNSRHTAGETFYEIALAEGFTEEEIPALMQAARTNALDAALKDGVITQEQADWMKSRGFSRGGRMGGNGYNGNCPMYDGDEGQFGPGSGYGSGMMRGWQNQ